MDLSSSPVSHDGAAAADRNNVSSSHGPDEHNNDQHDHNHSSDEHNRHDRPALQSIRSQPREPERQLGRTFVHGSHYSTAHPRLKAGTPEVSGSQWPAYASEGVREQTAELASMALSEANNEFQRLHHSIFPQNNQGTGTSNDGRDDAGFLPHNYFTKQKGASRRRSEDTTPLLPGSSGPSTLTHLLKTSPPNIPESTDEVIEEDNDGTGEADNLLLTSSPAPMGERDALLPKRGSSGSGDSTIPNYLSTPNRDEEGQYSRSKSVSSSWQFGPFRTRLFDPRSWDRKEIIQQGVLMPLGYLPAVVLGLLLNILDGLSYGMILFPLGEPIFSATGPDGLSMFYVSCIISQLVYSLGGSVFKGGIGSEMIEVVPFFHKMAYTIMNEVGKENEKAVLATTILSFSISSLVTGLVFFGLGSLRLGSLIGFFPRHILVGCIGGVGWFLCATGIEVAARLDKSLEYNIKTLKKLVEADTIFLWTTPLLLAVLLIILQHKFQHPFLVPAYFIAIPIVFYIIVTLVPALHIEDLRGQGWVFEAPASGVPFYHFYTLYDFGATDWGALLNTIPAMFALTFFGILHVPINVPALGVSTNEDHVDVNRELIAHGISNFASGMAGSIQNYLVYTNSVLFIRSGGDSRVAGVMLAAATTGVWMIGPGIIGYIPVMVVAALIYLLGIELLREALYDTWEKLHMLEYITICVIIVTMGAYDFVWGIFVGILLACVSFVVQTSQKSAIRSTYTGAIARSTVRRHPFQQRFLKEVGPQIQICKLAGYMFFGTISSVEQSIKELLEDQNFAKRPIRFLVVDLTYVRGFDFSAAEAFKRLKRILAKKNVNMVISGVQRDSDIGKGLKGVGIWGDDDDVRVFEDLNAALECCENEFLRAYYMQRDEHLRNATLEVPHERTQSIGSQSLLEPMFHSPRRQQIHQAATSTIKETEAFSSKWSRFKQPLPLILQTFQERTSKNEDFWFKAVPFFQRRVIKAGTVLFKRGDTASEFYLLEEGILKAEYIIEQGKYHESILAGTTCGELPFFSETMRTATVVAERDSVAWLLDGPSWEEMQEKHPEVANELLRIALKLTTERMEAVTSYVLTSAS